MSRVISIGRAWLAAAALAAPMFLYAQKEEKKEVEKKETRQITIVTTGDGKDEKLVIEVNGDKVTVNGKAVEDGKEGDVRVRVRKVKDPEALMVERLPGGRGIFNWNDGRNNFQMFQADSFRFFTDEGNRAMLGVTTVKAEEGAKVQDITPGSAAEKAELKENDIIVRVENDKIASPDDLSAAVKKHKPGDKVKITYLREKKEKTVTAELSKWKGVSGWSTGPGNNFRLDMDELGLGDLMQRIPQAPRAPFNNRMLPGGPPRMGMTVQDTEDGKGVKVIDVDEESQAQKADIRVNDVILEMDGKAVNGTDEIIKQIRESRDKTSVSVKLKRDGKTLTKEVKTPKKLKSADL